MATDRTDRSVDRAKAAMLATETFRFATPASPARVYRALTSTMDQGRYLQDAMIESSWTTGATLTLRSREGDPRHCVQGEVIAADAPCRLSYSLDGGTGPATYLTWQIRAGCGGSVVHLTVDETEGPPSDPAEDTWLPVLAALQSFLAAEFEPSAELRSQPDEPQAWY